MLSQTTSPPAVTALWPEIYPLHQNVNQWLLHSSRNSCCEKGKRSHLVTQLICLQAYAPCLLCYCFTFVTSEFLNSLDIWHLHAFALFPRPGFSSRPPDRHNYLWRFSLGHVLCERFSVPQLGITTCAPSCLPGLYSYTSVLALWWPSSGIFWLSHIQLYFLLQMTP